MKRLQGIAVLLVFLGLSSGTNATLIDFEGIKTADNVNPTVDVYRETFTERAYGDFRTYIHEGFYSGDDSTGIAASTPDNGSDYVVTSRISIYQENGGPFSLLSADFGERMLNYDDTPVKMIARYVDGSSKSEFFNFDHLSGFETFAFDTSWQNLSEVVFLSYPATGYMTLDNIRVSSSAVSVPEPSAAILLALGLIVVVMRKRAN